MVNHDILAELEQIEDQRLLLFHSLQDLHGGRSLCEYLKGFGGPDRLFEVEDLIKEGLAVYEYLRAVDYSATALQVVIDQQAIDLAAAHLPPVQQARAMAARKLLDHRGRVNALLAELRQEINTAAEQRGVKWTIDRTPLPWPDDDPREADRARGLRFGWTMPLNWPADSRLGKLAAAQPSASLRYALNKARKIGIDFVSVDDPPLTAWAHIESRPGEYDFAALDAALAEVKSAGLKIVLRLHALDAPPPQWLVQKLGDEASLLNIDGKPVNFWGPKEGGSTNLMNPAVREPFVRFQQAYARHVKDNWADLVLAVYVGGPELELSTGKLDKTVDFSSFSRDGTLITNDDVPADFSKLRSDGGSGDGNPAKWSDWLASREKWLAEYVRIQRDAIAPILAPIPVQSRTINDDMHRIFNEPHAPIQGKILHTLAALSANPNTGTTSPGAYEVLRSFAGRRFLWHYFMPIGCGSKTGSCSFESLFHDVSSVCYNAGPEGPLRFAFPGGWESYPDKQLGTFGIGSYVITPRQMQKIAPCVLSSQRPPAQVAILWSQSSLRFDANQRMRIEAIAMGHLLTRAFFPFDFVSEQHVRDGNLSQYKLLILPACKHLPDDVCQAVRDFVHAGGTLIGTSAPALFDEHGGGGKNIQLADVFGADFVKFIAPTGVEPQRLFTGHPEGPFLQPAPNAYQWETGLCAVVNPATAQATGWYFGSQRQAVALARNSFGKGHAIICGYPLGNEYYYANPYEVYFGAAHHRTAGGYTEGQVHKEKWMIELLKSLGIERPIEVKQSDVLRAQNRDDADWFHVYQRGPSYYEYQWETDNHVHSFVAYQRQREGIDTQYLCFMNSEMNYLLERGYIHAFVSAARIVARARVPDAKVLFDVDLNVPVPFNGQGGFVEFTTWVPLSQGKIFAAAPSPSVRVFEPARLSGVDPTELEKRCAAQTQGELPDLLVIRPEAIDEFLSGLRGKKILIGCGNTDYRAAADVLAKALREKFQADVQITTAGSRSWIRKAYQDSFGYNQSRPEEASAQILIGNTIDNGLMYRYDWHWTRERQWLPMNVNAHFPGVGHAVIQLAIPFQTIGNGLPEGKPLDASEMKLIIGASNPTDAHRAAKKFVEQLR